MDRDARFTRSLNCHILRVRIGRRKFVQMVKNTGCYRINKIFIHIGAHDKDIVDTDGNAVLLHAVSIRRHDNLVEIRVIFNDGIKFILIDVDKFDRLCRRELHNSRRRIACKRKRHIDISVGKLCEAVGIRKITWHDVVDGQPVRLHSRLKRGDGSAAGRSDSHALTLEIGDGIDR